MNTSHSNFEDSLHEINISDLQNILFGVEKESIRMSSKKISEKSHYPELGSALCNKYLTTDFSEAQLEFITPPFDSSDLTIEFLDALHHFAYKNIKNERLWPFSMPPYIDSPEQISIANYGKSNLSHFKMIYREGLALRYGRLMQAISGIHFNFSLPKSIFLELESKNQISERSFRDEIYLSGIRNIFRNNWLLLYLFGASPIVTKNFESSLSKDFLFKNGIYYLPNATSLRMSNLGYNNVSRSELFISLNNLNEYISELSSATNTQSKNFSSENMRGHEKLRQLNKNILQIEDEYYSVSRPKSLINDDSRLLSKLKRGGVDYIELRSIDINPYNNSGISKKSLEFLKLFTTYCLFSNSPRIDKTSLSNIRKNDLLVSRMGRKKDLLIYDHKNKVKLINRAKNIFEDLYKLNEMMGNNDSSIRYFEAMLDDSKLTPSSRLLNEFLNFGGSIEELGINIADKHKESLNKKMARDNGSFNKIILNEVERSKNEQNEMELDENHDLKIFLDNYFND
tara:strand:+ start:865 stop:2403 length:1539 start_codon:yes stop_codon:yes gene_type:complete